MARTVPSASDDTVTWSTAVRVPTTSTDLRTESRFTGTTVTCLAWRSSAPAWAESASMQPATVAAPMRTKKSERTKSAHGDLGLFRRVYDPVRSGPCEHIAARRAVQRRVAGMLNIRHINRPARMLTSINAVELAFVYRESWMSHDPGSNSTISTTCPVLMS